MCMERRPKRGKQAESKANPEDSMDTVRGEREKGFCYMRLRIEKIKGSPRLLVLDRMRNMWVAGRVYETFMKVEKPRDNSGVAGGYFGSSPKKDCV